MNQSNFPICQLGTESVLISVPCSHRCSLLRRRRIRLYPSYCWRA